MVWVGKLKRHLGKSGDWERWKDFGLRSEFLRGE